MVYVRFDRELVQRIVVLKCWETRFAFAPDVFLAGLPQAHYEWSDLLEEAGADES